MKRIIGSIVLFLLLSNQNISAQKIYSLTVDDAVKIALENSYYIKVLENDINSGNKWRLANLAGLKSNGNFQFVLPFFEEKIDQIFNSTDELYEFYKTKTMQWEGRFRLNQPLPTNGNISLNAKLLNLNQFKGSKDYTGSLYIEVSQPLFIPNKIQNEIEKSKLQLQKSENNLINGKLNITNWVTRTFYNLFRFNRRVNIFKESHIKLEDSYNLAKEKFDAGEISEEELTKIRIDLLSSTADLLDLESNYESEEEEFKNLIGIKIEDEVKIVEDLKFQRMNVNLNEAIMRGLEYRTELKNSDIDLIIQDINIENIEANGRIRGEFIATYGFDNTDPIFREIFSDYNKSRSLIFKITLPLWDWGRNKYQVQRARIDKKRIIERKENQKNSIIREIIDAVKQLEDAYDRIENLQEIMENAEKSYEMALSKFENQEIKSQDLLLARERRFDAENTYINSYINYKLAIVELKRGTLWDFINGKKAFVESDFDKMMEMIID